jgi:hypothetical protein
MLMQRTLQYPLTVRDRVTAGELINGVRCLVVLEQDMFGCYREKSVHPVAAEERAAQSSTSAQGAGTVGMMPARHASEACHDQS